MQPRGQSVIDSVDGVDGLLEGIHPHDAQDRGEVLGEMELAARHNTDTDTGPPQSVSQVPRSQHPVLVGPQRGQSPQRLLVVGHDDRSYLGIEMLGTTDSQGSGGVHELAGDALRGACRSDQNEQRARRALLPGVSEGGGNHIAHRKIRIGRRGDDHGVLSAGLPQQTHIRLPGAEEPRSVVGAGEYHAIHQLMRHQVTRDIAVVQRSEDHKILRQTRIVKGAHEFGGTALGGRRRFENDGVASGQGRRHSPGGDRQREVPRRGDHGQAGRHEAGAGHVGRIVQEQRGLGIVAAEVDGLADFGVGLVDGLAGFRGGDLNELPAAGGQDISDPVQHGRALGRVTALPGRRSGGCRLHDGVDLRDGDHAGGDRLDPGRTSNRGRHGSGDVAGPSPVGGQGRVRVRSRDEGTPDTVAGHGGGSGKTRLALGEAILEPIGSRHGGVGIEIGQGRQEAPFLASEDGRIRGQVEHPGHEVVRSGILLKTAYEIGDGDVELVRVDHGHVQQKMTGVVTHHLLQSGRHARQHLELDVVCDAASGPQLIGEGDVEQVLARHTEADGTGALRGHGPAQNALVVGVCGLLGRPRGQLPAVDLGVDPLHGQVGPLDHPHLDARTTGVHTSSRPFLKTLHGGQGVGQVGLQHNARLVVGQILLVEDGGEYRNGQVEVLVVLHVEVEEGAVITGQAVQGREHVHTVGDDLIEAPRIVRTGHRRDLDGDVVDVLTGHQAGDLRQALRGLLVPQNGLAQKIDVEPIATGAQASQSGPQSSIGGIDDEVADDLAENTTRHGGRRTRGQTGGPASQAHGCGQGGRQEVGTPSSQPRQGMAGDVEVGGPHDIIDEASGEAQAVRVRQDSRQKPRSAGNGLGRRLLGPAARACDRPLADLPQFLGATALGVVGHRVIDGGGHR